MEVCQEWWAELDLSVFTTFRGGRPHLPGHVETWLSFSFGKVSCGVGGVTLVQPVDGGWGNGAVYHCPSRVRKPLSPHTLPEAAAAFTSWHPRALSMWAPCFLLRTSLPFSLPISNQGAPVVSRQRLELCDLGQGHPLLGSGFLLSKWGAQACVLYRGPSSVRAEVLWGSRELLQAKAGAAPWLVGHGERFSEDLLLPDGWPSGPRGIEWMWPVTILVLFLERLMWLLTVDSALNPSWRLSYKNEYS